MTDSWELVQTLFEEAAGLAPRERARFLQARAGGDAELVRRVEALAEADARPHAQLDRSATELLHELRNEPPADALCGTVFGSYRVDAWVSSGGMAHVYRATRRTAGTERRVALKVLRPGLDTEAFLERFRRERQLLASLEHEHIVTFLDAGALPDGRPWLVMEYVEGESLVRWGQDQPLRRRLELFLQVAAAVQYAHQKLVVHRDLKPSNVLVTDQGVPKLLDFGVATALESEEPNGARTPLTPAYASPEQLRGEAVTTASDVWSLGVLLHELATGALPGDGTTLSGDLDAIVRRALAQDPARRYRSADLLSDDVRRHLAGEPVSARPDAWTYRATLFARRHRFALGFAAAIVLATIAGWIGSDLDRRRAEAEASIGWGAHAQAKVAARVFERWIAAVTASDAALASDAAAHMESALDDDLADWPEAETMVRIALAELYLERGERERAREHAERASRLAATVRGVGRVERERATALLQRATAE